jgi:hypothetical protein
MHPTRAGTRYQNYCWLLWLLAALVGLGACHHTPDDVAIRNAIADMTKAVEARDNRAFLTHVSENYRDHDGRDRQGLRQLLLANFVQNRNIVVLVSDIVIKVRDGRADVRLTAHLTSGEQLLADRRFGSYRLHSLWQREDGDWQIYQAEWEPLSEGQ